MWPLSRLRTYVANAPPVIHASDLNALQDIAVGIVGGLVTLAGVRIDGTGGVASAAPAGSLVVSRVTSGAHGALPLTALEKGELTKDLVPVGWAYIGAAGTLSKGVNVHSCRRVVDPGQYEIIFHTAVTDYAFTCPLISLPGLALVYDPPTWETSDDGAGRLKVLINIRSGGALVNGPFALMIMAT